MKARPGCCHRWSRPYQSTPASPVPSPHPAWKYGSAADSVTGYSDRNTDPCGWPHRTGTVLWLCHLSRHSVLPPGISSQNFSPSEAGASAYPLPRHPLRSCPVPRSSGLHSFCQVYPSECHAHPAMTSAVTQSWGSQARSVRRLSYSWRPRASDHRQWPAAPAPCRSLRPGH